jgi:hypothetical protein
MTPARLALNLTYLAFDRRLSPYILIRFFTFSLSSTHTPPFLRSRPPPPLSPERIVAKVTGVLPQTARNLEGQPKISHWHDYDVRYASFSTIAMVQGGPTCDTLDDAAFIRFYQNRPGWNEHRTFSLVAAEDPARTCGIYDPKEDLFLASTIGGAPQDYWGASCVWVGVCVCVCGGGGVMCVCVCGGGGVDLN